MQKQQSLTFGELLGASPWAESFISCSPQHSHLSGRYNYHQHHHLYFTNENPEAQRGELISLVLTANRARHKSISAGVKSKFLGRPTSPSRSCLFYSLTSTPITLLITHFQPDSHGHSSDTPGRLLPQGLCMGHPLHLEHFPPDDYMANFKNVLKCYLLKETYCDFPI